MPPRLSPEEVTALGDRRLRRLVTIAAVVLTIIAVCVLSFILFAESVGNGIL